MSVDKLFFSNGKTITICKSWTVSNIEDALVDISQHHKICRGKVIGIYSAPYDDGRIIKTAEIMSLKDIANDFVWNVIQEHQDDTIDELLHFVLSLKGQLEQKRPLSMEALCAFVSKSKIAMVWSSNAIEGSTYTYGETEMAIRLGLAATSKPLEDGNRAIDGGLSIDFLRDLVKTSWDTILSESQLFQMHDIVLKHSLTDALRGAYRDCPIFVTGCPYPFPEFDEVPRQMAEFLLWLNDPRQRDEHPAIFATEAHLRFITIHPFQDGNGRISRLLMNLVLIKCGCLPIVINPACRSEYLGFVKDFQVQKMIGRHDISKLLAMVAYEMMSVFELVLSETTK